MINYTLKLINLFSNIVKKNIFTLSEVKRGIEQGQGWRILSPT